MANEDLNFLPEILGAYIESLEKAAKGGSKEDKQKLGEARATYKKLKKTQAKLSVSTRKLGELEFSAAFSEAKTGISKLRQKLDNFLAKRRAKKIANVIKEIADLTEILNETVVKADVLMGKTVGAVEKQLSPKVLEKPDEARLPSAGDLDIPGLDMFDAPQAIAPIQQKMPAQKRVTVQDVMREVLDPKKTDKEREDALRSALSLPGAAEAMQGFIAAQLGTAQRQGGQKLLGDADKDKPIQSMKFDPKQIDILMRTFSAVWQDPGIASKAVAEISNRNPQVGRMLIEARPAAGPTPKAPAMIELPSSQNLEEGKEPQPPSQEQQDYKIVQLAKAVRGILSYIPGLGSLRGANVEEPKKPSPTPPPSPQDKGKEQKKG